MFKVLIVDDEQAARDGMRKALVREGGYEVFCASSLDEAEAEIQKQGRLDVVVVDLKLPYGERAGDERPGGEIVKWFTGKSTVTIVVTAYGTIENCAELMRAGAYDYIEKTKGDPYDRLLKSVRQGLEERARPKPDLNARWANENLSRLLDEYPGQYIAILDQEVVAAGPTYQDLRKKLDEEFPKQNPMIMSIPAMDQRSSLGIKRAGS